jgi:hypothetical protein
MSGGRHLPWLRAERPQEYLTAQRLPVIGVREDKYAVALAAAK